MQQPPNDQPSQPNTSYPSNPQGQQPAYAPPNTYQPPQQPPFQPSKKKSKAWHWITLGVMAVLLIGGIAVVTDAIIAANHAVPIASLAQTAVATAPSGNTPSTTGKVGQTISLQDNIAATLISVKKLPDDQHSPASPGNMYIVVHIKLVNNSSRVVDYGPFDFHVKSSSGNITNETFTFGYTANNQLNSGKLPPGGSVEGDLIFQTGKSDHKAQLIWQPKFFGNTGVTKWLLGI